MIKEKQYTKAWVSIFSILMFFISFFATYFGSGIEIGTAFVRAVFVLFITNLIARFLVFLWQISIPRDQWLLIVHGPPDVLSRSEKLKKEREKENTEE